MYEYLKRLQEWQKEGRRSVRFDLEPNEEMSIWIYDYEIMCGIHVQVGDPLPTRADLIEKKKTQLLCALEGVGE